MPMIHSQVEILLVVKQEKEAVASRKPKPRSDVPDVNERCILYPFLTVVTEVSITEEILNQLKNEEWLYEIA